MLRRYQIQNDKCLIAEKDPGSSLQKTFDSITKCIAGLKLKMKGAFLLGRAAIASARLAVS